MLLYTAYMMVSVIYFADIKPRVGNAIQCFFFLDATLDLALSNPVCGLYLLAWCLSTGFVFWVYFKCHWENLRDKAYQLLLIKTVAQIIMCIAGVSPQIPITVSCCAYVLCLVEYLNWRCCDAMVVIE
jgi:hypothetical protein